MLLSIVFENSDKNKQSWELALLTVRNSCSSKMSAQAHGVPTETILKLANEQVLEIAAQLEGSSSDVARALPPYDVAEPFKTRMALDMIDAGIDVRSEPAALKWCVSWLLGKVRSLRDKKHYRCPESWRAFIIPDFSQKLGPREAMFWVSDEIGYLEGEALVARNPCTAPWDVQKLTFLGKKEVLRRFGFLQSRLDNALHVLSCFFSVVLTAQGSRNSCGVRLPKTPKAPWGHSFCTKQL